jgi:cellulose synthase/poly-beta-1,6-N-acetylglucosamine synthase-like glycosyltransferase
MVGYFEDRVGLVVGQVRQRDQRWWHRLRSLERLSLIAGGGGAIGWGVGLTAVGSNLGYRKEVFEEVGGFHDVAEPLSGDDDLFIQLVSRRTRWALRYAFQAQAAVYTDPPATLSGFVGQERRRTSKGRYYPLWVKALATEAFLLNLSLIISVPLALAHPVTRPLPLLAFGMKVLSELLLLLKASRLFGQRGLLRYYPLAAILHIPYFLIFSIWGTLGEYRWKSKSGNIVPATDSSGQWDRTEIC